MTTAMTGKAIVYGILCSGLVAWIGVLIAWHIFF